MIGLVLGGEPLGLDDGERLDFLIITISPCCRDDFRPFLLDCSRAKCTSSTAVLIIESIRFSLKKLSVVAFF